MYKFTLEGMLNASVSDVFDAFSKPELIVKWCAPGRLTVCKYIGEISVGSNYRLVFESDDGFRQMVEGTYNLVEKDKKLSFTWRWEDTHEMTKVCVSFVAIKNGNTQFELSQVGFKYHNDMLQQQYAWLDCLEKLSRILPASEPNAVLQAL
ncbi:SRPBCC family protein [Agaribacter flavus]|uniref:SRPBCC domain-containing protein n=1 Tax=Agaribacter flavus TaxID=1902781 RepID=A0ABV7FSE6_9ALTE